MLVQALKTTLFSEGAKPSTDKAVFEEARVTSMRPPKTSSTTF
jgi:hypothetical protein